MSIVRWKLLQPDLQVDRRRPDRTRERCDHHVSREQDRPTGQETGDHGRWREEGQGIERDVH